MWTLVRAQRGVISRAQLLGLGFSHDAIRHRLRAGRLFPLLRGVYAVGRRDVPREGWWIAVLLACGPGAAIGGRSAAVSWGLIAKEGPAVEVIVPPARRRRVPGARIVRARLGTDDVTVHDGVVVTSPARTILDLATVLRRPALEAAINAADKRDLLDPEGLRAALGGFATRRGVRVLRETLDRHTFVLTESELERRFLPIAARAGLPPPTTGARVNGYRVDFYWPDLGLVVETDGLRYHRTPEQQTHDRRRDQAHTASGLTQLRFSHAQVRFEPGHVRATLARVGRRLARVPGFENQSGS